MTCVFDALTNTTCAKSCMCDLGYHGDACQDEYNLCDGFVDAMNTTNKCFYGGRCKLTIHLHASHEADQFWSCDCMEATVEGKPYVGTECEIPHQTSCETGIPVSSKSFCVNDGSCVSMIAGNETHQGCSCVGDWEGDHCEYKKGSQRDKPTTPRTPNDTPESDHPKAAATPLSDNDEMGTLSVLLVTIFVLAFVAGVMWVTYNIRSEKLEYDSARRSRRRGKKSATEVPAQMEDNDLQLQDVDLGGDPGEFS